MVLLQCLAQDESLQTLSPQMSIMAGSMKSLKKGKDKKTGMKLKKDYSISI